MSNTDNAVTRISDLEMADEEDFDFQTLENNQMSSSMNDEDQRKIVEIETDLINSSQKYASPSVCTLYNFFQENVDGMNNMERPQHSELINNNVSLTNPNPFHMDLDNVDKEPEQISLDTNSTASDEQHFNNVSETNDATSQPEQTSEPLTTGEQQMNALEYCRKLLEKLTLAVNTLAPALGNLAISAKRADDYLQNLSIPSPNEINLTSQDPLNKLSNLAQTGINLLPSFRQICNKDNINPTDPIGEELNETLERTTSAPSEHNGSHLNQEIQALTQSKLPTSTISKDIDSAALRLSLSKLLSQSKTIIYDLKLAELKIFEQPRQLWKKRSINCLKNKWCSAIQGRSGKQRRCIGIKWSKLTGCNRRNLFILVQLLSYDDHPHPTNVLVPAKTRVKQPKLSLKRKTKVKIRSTLKDLIINNEYGFDEKSKTLLCPITEKEYRQCKKNLRLIMFSLYKTSEEIGTDEENEGDISIADELHKLSKLRISLCRRAEKGKLVHVSNSVDTELIEQSKSSEVLAIDSKKVTPACLCKCGNETITVTLNTDSEKSGFVVRLNNTLLDSRQIRGVTKKQIFFNSLPRTVPGQKSLNVKVSKKSILKTIKENANLCNGLREDPLLNIDVDYVEHSENPHEHKDTITELSIQSNEIGLTELW